MKQGLLKLFVASALLLVTMPLSSQTTLTIQNGQFDNYHFPSFPTKQIEYIDNGIIVTYTFSDVLSICDYEANGAFDWLIPGFTNLSIPNLPSVPAHTDIFTIPVGYVWQATLIEEEFRDYEVATKPAHPLPNIYYEEGQPNSMQDFTGFYPAETLSELETEYYRARPIVKFQINPVKYNKKDKTTRFYTKIKYKIEYQESDTQYTGIYSDDAEVEVADNILPSIGENSILNRIGVPLIKNRTNISTRGMDPITIGPEIGKSMLIITNDALLPAASKLAEWKLCLGIRTYIESSTSWQTEDIKQLVDLYYKNEGIEYLLIIGDDKMVTAYQDSVKTLDEITNEYYYSGYKTDHPYVCMDGPNDTFADIHKGRIPSSTLEQAYIAINKIIKYEKEPPTDPKFYLTGLHCAQFEPDTNCVFPSYNRERYRFIFTSENIKSYLENHYGMNIGRVYGKTTSKDDPKEYNPYYLYENLESIIDNDNSIIDTITNKIDEDKKNEFRDELKEYFKFPEELLDSTLWNKPKMGYAPAWNFWAKQHPSFIFYSGHGNFHGWGAPAIYTQTIDNNKALSSIKDPVMLFSVTCRTGGYDRENCFVKYWLDQPGGALGAFAATNLTYIYTQVPQIETMINCIWPKNRIIPFYSHLMEKFKTPAPNLIANYLAKLDSIYAYPYPTGMRMGEVLDESLSALRDYPNESDRASYHRKASHYFGDPTMQWLIEKPKSIISGPNYSIQGNYGVFSYNERVPALTVYITSTNEMYSMYNAQQVKIPLEEVPHAVVTAHGYGYIPNIWEGLEVNLRALSE